MRFIELHRLTDRVAILLNLDEILCIRPSNDGNNAIVEWRSAEMALPTAESYRDIKGMLVTAKVLIL